jgi:hypothetical protein
MLDDVIAGKAKLREAAKKAPTKPRRPKKEIPFEDQVYHKRLKWIGRFSPPQRRQIIAVMREWTAWLNGFDAPQRWQISVWVRDWIAWLSRFEVPEQRAQISSLVHGWTGSQQKGGAK